MTHGFTFPVRALEDLSRCVVLLDRPFPETVEVDGETAEVWLKEAGRKAPRPKLARHLGSGFLVATGTAAFLVTAAHVARRMDRETRLSFAGRRGKRSYWRFRELLALGRRQVPWVFHPRTDAAVVRIPKPPTALRKRFLDAAQLVSEKSAPSGSSDLIVVGFPLGLISETHFRPIAKRFHAASGILRFRGEEMRGPADFFLLDQATMGGYSGAPVFTVPQVQLGGGEQSFQVLEPRCVGLVSQTISDEAGGQFGMVVPSADVKAVLTQAG